MNAGLLALRVASERRTAFSCAWNLHRLIVGLIWLCWCQSIHITCNRASWLESRVASLDFSWSEYHSCWYVQAGRPKKSFLFGPFFFNITNVFCAKKRVWHACICPRIVTGYSQFWSYTPPQNNCFSAAKKRKFPTENAKRDCARPLLKKNLRPKFFSSSFLAVFVGDSITPMSTLAHNKRSCSKKWKKIGQNSNCVFPVFPAKILARFCHAVLDSREHQGLPPD